jgi:sec-independent protein translocase protein TatB
LGPKELPNALRTASQWMRAARKLAGEFQSGVNEIIREADLEDARKQLQGMNTNTIAKHIENTVDPTGELKSTFNEPIKPDEPAKLDEPEKPAVADFDAAPTLPPSATSTNTTPTPSDQVETTAQPVAEQPITETAGAAEKS